jgi:hypothetical protein
MIFRPATRALVFESASLSRSRDDTWRRFSERNSVIASEATIPWGWIAAGLWSDWSCEPTTLEATDVD